MVSNAYGFEKIIGYTPVFGLLSAFRCGFDQTFYDGDMDYTLVPNFLLKNIVEPYIIVASGDSMKPTICDGDVLIIDTAIKPRHGEAGAFVLNGEFIVKRLINNNFSWYLKSDNSEYENRKITDNDNFNPLGRVVKIIKEL